MGIGTVGIISQYFFYVTNKYLNSNYANICTLLT